MKAKKIKKYTQAVKHPNEKKTSEPREKNTDPTRAIHKTIAETKKPLRK